MRTGVRVAATRREINALTGAPVSHVASAISCQKTQLNVQARGKSLHHVTACTVRQIELQNHALSVARHQAEVSNITAC